jgi:citrate synthase
MAFARARPDVAANPLWQLVDRNSRIAPKVLAEHGKTKNPNPNVDSASGVLFHHYGIEDTLYYTVVFGVSRALCLTQIVWDRALGLPIERPKSLTLDSLRKLVEKA